MEEVYFKLTRLYVDADLYDQAVIGLSAAQAHYLHNVMRQRAGEKLRLFNGRDGEWLGSLQEISKKSASVALEKQIKAQPSKTRKTHLLFPPIKKNRQDWLIEKAVELGVSEFHPIITQNTQIPKINAERVSAQIFEASEQCERFEIPTLHKLEKIEAKLSQWPQDIPILSCLERYDAPALKDLALDANQDIAILIGPEGGFTGDEKNMIAQQTTPVDLGDTILRVETAVVKALILTNP